MIEAKVICDSVTTKGHRRLTTFQVKLHRFILAEVNTHRMLSRNYRSSRAVPAAKLIEEVRSNPAMPVYWGKNQAGMQAAEELAGQLLNQARTGWEEAAKDAADWAEHMADSGLHKQIANRVLEPFLWVHGVISATEWDNFFGLRLHKDAQPEFRALAEAMWEARKASTPRVLDYGEWHLPYFEWEKSGPVITNWNQAIVQSVARCARVSYKPFDSDAPSTLEEDQKLYDRLLGSQPIHASPAEHQAMPDHYAHQVDGGGWTHSHRQGNFVGWIQFRKTITGESCAPLPEKYLRGG